MYNYYNNIFTRKHRTQKNNKIINLLHSILRLHAEGDRYHTAGSDDRSNSSTVPR